MAGRPRKNQNQEQPEQPAQEEEQRELTPAEIEAMSEEDRAAYIKSILGEDDHADSGTDSATDSEEEGTESEEVEEEDSEATETPEGPTLTGSDDAPDDGPPAAGMFQGDKEVTGQKKEDKGRKPHVPPADPPPSFIGRHQRPAFVQPHPNEFSRPHNPSPSQDPEQRFIFERGYFGIVDAEGNTLFVIPELEAQIMEWLNGRLVGGFALREGKISLATENDGQKKEFFLPLTDEG